MKKITILTLFKDVFTNFLDFSIIRNAIKKKKIEINIIDFRKFSSNKHHKVDDYQFGGGPGMIIALPAIVKAINKYKTNNTKIILLSPQGKTYNQSYATKLANNKKDLLIICGHYEGFDARINNYIDETISIGDYVLTGGELPAMVLVDSITRLIDGVIKKESLNDESFKNNLLDYDSYTRPINFDGYVVPKILLSGNHEKINDFRKKNQIKKTLKLRPDLLKK